METFHYHNTSLTIWIENWGKITYQNYCEQFKMENPSSPQKLIQKSVKENCLLQSDAT